MWLTVVFTLGTLIAFSFCDICTKPSDEDASWVQLKAMRHCTDEEEFCPYLLTLPPLYIQLPLPFKELGTMAKELQSLKEMVNQLKSECQECKDKHSFKRGGGMDQSKQQERSREYIKNEDEKELIRILSSSYLEKNGTTDNQGSIKNLDQLILGGEEKNVYPNSDSNQAPIVSRDLLTDEMHKGAFNPAVFVKTVNQLSSKQGDIRAPSLVHTATHREQQEKVVMGDHLRNTSGILRERVRIPDLTARRYFNETNSHIRTGDRRDGPLWLRRFYVNSKASKVNTGDTERSPHFERTNNPQFGGTMTGVKEATLSPSRSPLSSHVKKSHMTSDTNIYDLKDLREFGKRNHTRLNTEKQGDQTNINSTQIRFGHPGMFKEKKEVDEQSRIFLTAGNSTVNKVLQLQGRHAIKSKEVNSTNNGQPLNDSTDTFDERFGISQDITHHMQGTGYTLTSETLKKDQSSHGKISISETDLVKTTAAHSVKNKSMDGIVTVSNRLESFLVENDTRGISVRKAEHPHNNTNNVTRTQEESRGIKYTITNERNSHDSSVISSRSPTARQLYLTNRRPANRSPWLHSNVSTSLRNGSGIFESVYRRTKPVFHAVPHSKRGMHTKSGFFLPNSGTSTTIKKEDKHLLLLSLNTTIAASKSTPDLKAAANVQDFDNFKGSERKTGDKAEMTSNGNNAQLPKDNTSHLPTVEKENSFFSVGTVNMFEEGKMNSSNTTISLTKQEPTHLPTSIGRFLDTKDENKMNKSHVISRTYAEMFEKISLDTPIMFENEAGPNVTSSALLNPSKNNIEETKSPRNPDNIKDLENNHQAKDSGTMLNKNKESSQGYRNLLPSKAENVSSIGEERNRLHLGTTAQVDKTGRSILVPTLKNVSSNEPGMIPHKNSTGRGYGQRANTDVKEMNTVNDTQVPPMSLDRKGATKELVDVKRYKDRFQENPGEILHNLNREDTTKTSQVWEVEEIQSSRFLSLSPDISAEGFKTHAATDEVTPRQNEEGEIHSTCHGDCNNMSKKLFSHSKTQRGTAFDRENKQDCTDYMTKSQRNGVYSVTRQPQNITFSVLCDMETLGGGWTLIQNRFDGSTSFNRTWEEYKSGFGKLTGEFWIGNDKMNLLTNARNMSLRIEMEDFKGIREYANYDHFFVADESQQYRLSIGGYSGTAGNAMQFSEGYNHDQKLFTTPDRDNDQYPSGNCGAYYSSGWWFDACMSANLNGKYYHINYKGVRNGIFWGTWHNITREYYPTNHRNSFKTVRMMIRPEKYPN